MPRPGINRYDFGCISATPFAVMELLDGETLRERLARGAISTARTIAWATKIAEGAAAAHERGIVHRDLKPEKDPGRRFQSMRDVVFDLSNLIEPSTSTAHRARPVPAPRSRRLRIAGTAVAGVALAATTFWLGTRMRSPGSALPAKVTFQTVSFGRGIVDAARFTPDGQTIVYGAAWDGQPFRLLLTRPGSPDTTALGLPDADLLAVSPSGELAIALAYRLGGWMGRGTLARVPMLGAAPRDVADDVLAADWSPDGSELAVVRWAGGRKRLEYPVGTVLYETGGWISHPRFSADGSRIAFIDHPVDGDDRGSAAVLDLRSRTRRTLGGEWSGVQGLAWAPSGTEVFFSAYDGATPHSVHAVDLQGHTRQLLTGPTGLFLQDVARDGRLLVASQTRSIQVLAQLPGDERQRDLSWLSYSFAVDVSADGRRILLECAGDSCGETYTVFVRNTDGAPAVRLGEGSPRELSPDGTQAVAIVYGLQLRLVVYPLGAGRPRSSCTGLASPRRTRARPTRATASRRRRTGPGCSSSPRAETSRPCGYAGSPTALLPPGPK